MDEQDNAMVQLLDNFQQMANSNISLYAENLSLREELERFRWTRADEQLPKPGRMVEVCINEKVYIFKGHDVLHFNVDVTYWRYWISPEEQREMQNG